MTKSFTCPLLAALFAFSFSLPVLASTPRGTWVINLDQGSGSVEFDAIGHPSALKIVGKGAAPHGSFQVRQGKVSGKVAFDLNTLDTGIAMRTRHMKEKYLETGKYQQATLTVRRLELPKGSQLDRLQAASLPFSGMLKLHGVERPVNGTARIQASGGKISIAASFALKVSDYGITIPSFAGITMTDEVKVSVTDQAQLSKAN